MFAEDTLLILGAGASMPYGFPSGDDFVGQIINNIRKDSIFFPLTSSNQKDIIDVHTLLGLNEYQIIIDENDVENKLMEIRKEIKRGMPSSVIKKTAMRASILRHNKQISSLYNVLFNQNLVILELNDIKELSTLAGSLEEFHPVSIDAFLRDHPEHEDAGRCMIIYTLLKYHDSEKFRKDAIKDNWYRYLLNDIKSGCARSEDILNNSCKILTFNYDVSLEYYLRDRLSKTSYFEGHHEEFFKSFRIEHVYGSICDLEKVSDLFDIKNSINNSQEEAKTLINFHNFVYAFINRKRIKLIGERIGDEKIYSLIKEAEKIIIIGFGFDADNVHLLFNGNYRELLNNKFKKLYYLDYAGAMNGLYDEFSKLESTFGVDLKFKVVRSTQKGNSPICNAYNHDFKTKLHKRF